MNVDGSDPRRLTRNQVGDHEPDWSPDGTHIAFASQQGEYANIYVMNVAHALRSEGTDSSDWRQLTDTDAHDAYPDWSPDGTQIAFCSKRDGNWEIYVMNADGSDQRRLTHSGAFNGAPRWSPDGTQIAFESNREIYVMNADGTNVRRLTDNSFADRRPAWRPNMTAVTPLHADNACACSSLDPLQTQLVYDVATAHDAGAWSISTPGEEGMDADRLETGVTALAEFSNLYSVLILRNDKIVLERYFQQEEPQHARNIQSASKSFLSALVGIAIHEGYIQSVDQTAAEFLPTHFAAVQDPHKLDITLHHLLTMRPGFSYQDALYDLRGDWLAEAIAYPLASAPGSEFNYSTLSSHILSAILAEATGMSTCAFACQYLFQPLGITIDNWSRDPQGYYMGGVAMYFTPRELARFGLLYLHDGVWEGQQVIPSEWIAASMTRHVNETGFPGVSYGYHWWRESAAGYEVYAAVGHGGQTIRVVPDLDLVVVTTADSYAPAQGIEVFPFLEEYVIPSIQVAAQSEPSPLDGSGRGVIAFYSERDGNAEIYVMNIAHAPRGESTYGSDLRRLTNNRADDTSPAWSPDGTQIAFVSDRDDPNPINCSPDCDYKIYVMNSDGSGQRRLTDSPLKESHPAWSPDGAWIVFDTDHDEDGHHEIYVVNSDGSSLRQLTDDAARDHWADWSPDGAQILFSSTRDGYAEIYVMSVVADTLRSEGADGGDLQRLTHSEEVWDDIPRWSPDGAHIAFVSARNGNRDIYTMDSDGSDPQRLTSDPAEDMCPDWSPDGAQLVFNSERHGNWEIYVVNVDGSGLRRLTDHPDGDYQPAWRPAVADILNSIP
jgi:Tol biopolymer transport system component/CubicO group peptidase (beta-lactamase class C family)